MTTTPTAKDARPAHEPRSFRHRRRHPPSTSSEPSINSSTISASSSPSPRATPSPSSLSFSLCRASSSPSSPNHANTTTATKTIASTTPRGPPGFPPRSERGAPPTSSSRVPSSAFSPWSSARTPTIPSIGPNASSPRPSFWPWRARNAPRRGMPPRLRRRCVRSGWLRGVWRRVRKGARTRTRTEARTWTWTWMETTVGTTTTTTTISIRPPFHPTPSADCGATPPSAPAPRSPPSPWWPPSYSKTF
mmetsp:Transcript_11914/g.25331  ORF Transcript_11914/g.25331 Transcript_11914/m.25331 type:complete len:248 (-) Transcript_11914:507-1250(-)